MELSWKSNKLWLFCVPSKSKFLAVIVYLGDFGFKKRKTLAVPPAWWSQCITYTGETAAGAVLPLYCILLYCIVTWLPGWPMVIS